MRTLLASILLVAACTVPDKQPATGDGSDDIPVDPNAVPDTMITSSPGEFSNNGTATFEFESNIPSARFTCSLDGEPSAPCTSPFARALGDGPHTFSVRAINASGLADDSPAEHLWSIDTVAPQTTLTEAPPSADNSTDVRFSFISNEMFVAFECSLDGAAFTECRSADTFGPIGDGAHSFAVRAKDRAGNVDASPAVHAWQVDTSTPDTTIVSGPSGSVASATATFSFLSPDAGPGSTFECSLDGSAFAACTSPVTYNVAMGVHTFSVRVRDANGNYDPTPATRTWTADITPPETTITAAPSGTVAMASASISFTANEATATYTCSLDGGAYAPCTSPYNVLGLAQGAHSFSVIATDEAGNADPSPATATWTVDTVTPTVAFSVGPAEGETVGPLVVFGFTASEGTPQCRVDGGAWMACTSSFSFNHPAGTATFEVRVVDGAGNETIATRSFSVECAEPEITGSTVGLLRLETMDQSLANSTGGASATLGTTTDAEAVDPSFSTGRLGSGLTFTPGEGDVVTWPLTAGAQPQLAVELWVNATALSGTRDLVTSGDGVFSLRVMQESGSTVRFIGTVTGSGGVMYSVTSAPYSASAWHLVALSQTNNTLTLYVDGDVFAVSMMRTEVSLDTLRVGGNFGGSLDEIWVATAPYENPLARYCPATTIRYN